MTRTTRAVSGKWVRSRQGIAYSGQSLRRMSSAGNPEHGRERRPCIGPVPAKALDQLVWPIGVSVLHTRSHTAV